MDKKLLSEAVSDALTIIDEEYPYLSGVDEVAERVGLSTGYFHRLFKKEMGDTPGRYLRKIKIEKSKSLLLNQNITLAEISWVCGFADPCEFNKIFKKETGQTPGSYRKLNLDYISENPTRESQKLWL